MNYTIVKSFVGVPVEEFDVTLDEAFESAIIPIDVAEAAEFLHTYPGHKWQGSDRFGAIWTVRYSHEVSAESRVSSNPLFVAAERNLMEEE